MLFTPCFLRAQRRWARSRVDSLRYGRRVFANYLSHLDCCNKEDHEETLREETKSTCTVYQETSHLTNS